MYSRRYFAELIHTKKGIGRFLLRLQWEANKKTESQETTLKLTKLLGSFA
jgi:hypothetical protein